MGDHSGKSQQQKIATEDQIRDCTIRYPKIGQMTLRKLRATMSKPKASTESTLKYNFTRAENVKRENFFTKQV